MSEITGYSRLSELGFLKKCLQRTLENTLKNSTSKKGSKTCNRFHRDILYEELDLNKMRINYENAVKNIYSALILQ